MDMDIVEIRHNGSGYNKEHNYHNHAMTLIFRKGDREKTVRANLRYYETDGKWDINPIFYEFSEEDKEALIQKILETTEFDMEIH